MASCFVTFCLTGLPVRGSSHCVFRACGRDDARVIKAATKKQYWVTHARMHAKPQHRAYSVVDKKYFAILCAAFFPVHGQGPKLFLVSAALFHAGPACRQLAAQKAAVGFALDS